MSDSPGRDSLYITGPRHLMAKLRKSLHQVAELYELKLVLVEVAGEKGLATLHVGVRGEPSRIQLFKETIRIADEAGDR